MKFQNRFAYGFAPETGKKADLMFVQHMIASLNTKGCMATIMPHGVLFRGSAEKVIRKGIVDANLIEAIISLPPALFYGTGIPACVLVINKNKDEKLRDKIFFINADAEYGEGKVQNFLRPEDIEKIDFVFTHKKEIEKYSKLVNKKTIEEHDYNLNIRRYIDNTPEPEPEDVKAHLIGGVPTAEVESQNTQHDKFGFKANEVFKAFKENYQLFKEELPEKVAIKATIEENKRVQQTIADMQQTIDKWWLQARDEFSRIAAKPKVEKTEANGLNEPIADYLSLGGGKMPEVRQKLISSLKTELIAKNVLDEYQVAGVFVNWWTNIKYDLKTIATIGWVPSLVPKEYFIETYFKAEQEAIQEAENLISEKESTLQEAFEAVEYEPEEPEEGKEPVDVTPKVIKDYLASQIRDLKIQKGAEKELKELTDTLEEIKGIEKEIKEAKNKVKELQSDLERKIEYKMYGVDDAKEEIANLLANTKKRIGEFEAQVEPEAKKEKTAYTKTLKALKTDSLKMEENLKGLDAFLEKIGGIITVEECKTLILQKHNSLVQKELLKYLNAEKRSLLAGIEKLWDKYKVTSQQLENNRKDSLDKLNKFLTQLNYLS
jgi:type I restriction enzyme M protein